MIKKILMWFGIVLGGLFLLLVLGLFLYTNNNLNYFKRAKKGVDRAGFAVKYADINGSKIAYLEGPDNGPALLLIHGQITDKYSYASMLPLASKSFHVFAVDCYGHGESSHDPAKYSNAAQGQDLLAFIKDVIKKPCLVSGHSSGGLISSYLAAYGEGWVKGVLFEDPPFFTVSLPRAQSTWNWVDTASNAHNFLESGEKDWVMYCIENAKIWSFFGEAKDKFLDEARVYHAKFPNDSVKWAWMPPVMNETYRAVGQYDPRFGDVFYHGEWERGFDLEAALRSVTIPVIYQKSNSLIDENGVLRGATSDEEAKRALSLLKGAAFYTDVENHAWHVNKPREAVQRLIELKDTCGL